jgi:hypothetical protein
VITREVDNRQAAPEAAQVFGRELEWKKRKVSAVVPAERMAAFAASEEKTQESLPWLES